MPVCDQWVITSPENGCENEVKIVSVYEINKEDWQQLLIDYLEPKKIIK